MERQCLLLIEGDAADAKRMVDELSSTTEERFQVECVNTISSGIERLRMKGVGAVILDLTLPDSGGIETFEKISPFASRLPILILSGPDTEEIAKDAVQRGALGYLVKKADGNRLRWAVRTMSYYGIQATGCGRVRAGAEKRGAVRLVGTASASGFIVGAIHTPAAR